MRFKLYFKLENEIMPIDYRRSILSYIKLSLMEYGEEYLKKFYNERENIIKPYTFSVFFKNPKITQDEIIVENKEFEINFSVSAYEAAVILLNSFNHQKLKKFSINKNSWTLKSISLLPEKKISTNNITIKFLSPLCARGREDNKDYYYSFKHKEFENILKINIKEQIKITDFPEAIVHNLKIVPVNAKKVIIKFYEKKMECSTGTFVLNGDIELLNYLYQSGIGSRHSAGFGMFQII